MWCFVTACCFSSRTLYPPLQILKDEEERTNYDFMLDNPGRVKPVTFSELNKKLSLLLIGKCLEGGALCMPFSEYRCTHALFVGSILPTRVGYILPTHGVSILTLCSTLRQFIDILGLTCRKSSYTWSHTSPVCRKSSYTWPQTGPVCRKSSYTWPQTGPVCRKSSYTWSQTGPVCRKSSYTWPQTGAVCRKSSYTWSRTGPLWWKCSYILSHT